MSCTIDRRRYAVLLPALIAGLLAPPSAVVTAGEAANALQLAQAAPQSAPRAGAPKGGGPPPQAQPPQGPGGETEGQIADLRRRLNITPAQQPLFDAVAQAMRQNAQDMSAMAAQAQATAKPSAVDAVRTAGRFADAEAAGIKRLLPPLQTLYDNLSEPQKRAADQAFAAGPEPAPPPGKRP